VLGKSILAMSSTSPAWLTLGRALPTKGETSMASKGINVKIYRTKLLTALQDKLDEVQSNQALYEAAVKAHKDIWEDYQNKVKKIAVKSIDSVTNVTESRWQSDDNFKVYSFDVKIPVSQLPEQPEEPLPPYRGGRGYGRNYVSNDYEDIFADMSNAIRMLKLSDEEVISTATYASVAKYL
jgi:hypothetical protein